MLAMSMASPAPSVRIMDPENYKRRVLAMFEKRSSVYDNNDTFHSALARATVDRAKLQPVMLMYRKQHRNKNNTLRQAELRVRGLDKAAGERVLDLATGTGLVALDAAHWVGPQGSVLGMDLTAEMLAKAQEKAAQQQLPNVRFETGDMDALELPAGAFDAALCSNGIIFCQDVGGVLHRISWCLRAGGRLVFNTPMSPMFTASAVLHEMVREQYDLPLVDAGAPLAAPPMTRALLLASGFAKANPATHGARAAPQVEVAVTEETRVFAAATPETFAAKMWDMNTTFPFIPLRAALSEDQVEALRQPYIKIVEDMSLKLQTPAGICCPFKMQWVVAHTAEG